MWCRGERRVGVKHAAGAWRVAGLYR
jgi:hypothetical protein